MVIFCIGDSHVSLFSGINRVQPVYPPKCQDFLPFFKVFPLGAVLAYNLIEKNTKTRGREKLFDLLNSKIPKNSNILLSFGEIDCRAHLIKQSNYHKIKIEDTVNKCVERYFYIILEVRRLGFKPIIYNAIPSSRDGETNNKEYPAIGSCKERNSVTKLFNERLEMLCRKNNIPFINTFNYFVDKSGLTSMNWYMDPIHLSQNALPVTLRAIEKELSINLITDPIQIVIYKKINLYLNSLRVLKKFKNSISKAFQH